MIITAMKKILLFLILVLSATVAIPQSNQKKIKFSNYAYYEGVADKKSPCGSGTLYPCSRCLVTGIFNNNKISNGKIVFNDHTFVITGEFTYAVIGEEQFVIIINNGKINRNQLPKNTPIKFDHDNYVFESHYTSYPKLPKSYYEMLKQFAGETQYQRRSDGRKKNIYNNEKCTRKTVTKSSYLEVNFPSGVVARYEVADRSSNWLRPNGDFVNFVLSDNEYNISDYKITSGRSTITPNEFTYIFENGNKYIGSVSEPSLKNYVGEIGLERLANFRDISWDWSGFKDKALDGVVIYADGSSEKVVNGVTASETARIEAKRKAEEAARIAAEKEAKRKAEEAARIAAEKEAKRKAEEAARIAAEKEAKRKAEEAARIAAEEEAKRKAEEAARIAAEEEAKRKAEAARIAAEEEAKRKAEMAAYIAAAEEAKRKAEMAARIAEERSRSISEKESMQEAMRARIVAEREQAAAERERVAAENARTTIVSAFEFIATQKSHTSISEDSRVPRLFCHPSFNPYSPNFRSELASRLAAFCPCVGYDIVSINENSVICNLGKREANGTVSIYQLTIKHNGGLLDVTSFDIGKANKIR